MDDMGSTEEATVEEGADAKQGHGEYAEEEWEQQDEEGEREEEEEQQQGLRHTLHNGAIPGAMGLGSTPTVCEEGPVNVASY